jgi:radical S-adenosyl methionine domain-containing protein 2
VKAALAMPDDLAELLPKRNPIVFLLLELSEAERARRVRSRIETMPAGFALAITREERELERSSSHRERLTAAYRSLRIEERPLTDFDASGSQDDVVARALNVIQQNIDEKLRLVPKSVNWHFTRQCNYSCKFCFHTATSSFFLPNTPAGMEESKKCLMKLREAGMEKLNFSGGEPFLQSKELGELCRFCKEDLGLDSVSIISNGSKIQKRWLQKYGDFVDILAISCDSFVEDTNKLIGRGKGMHLTQLQRVRDWCTEYEIPFKLNSVINTHNVDEDMNEAITKLNPVRWKVFQCLILDGENAGAGALRDAQELVITDDQFRAFEQRHRGLTCLVPESNEKMKNSYLILDEELRFLNCTGGKKTPSRSIRNVSVNVALQEAGFDGEMFVKRGGIYDWSRPAKPSRVEIEDLAAAANTRGKRKIQESKEHDCEDILSKEARSSKAESRTRKLLALAVGGVILAGTVRLLAKPAPSR